MELRRREIKRWVPYDDMNCKLKTLHSAKVGSGFGHLPKNAYTVDKHCCSYMLMIN